MQGWYSTIGPSLLGLPTYIQQFYLGVRDAENLRRTFRLQAPIFFFAAFTLWIIGMFASGVFPALSESQSEQVVPYLLGAFVQLEGSTLLPSLILDFRSGRGASSGALVLETLFVVFSTYIWRKKPPEDGDRDASVGTEGASKAPLSRG